MTENENSTGTRKRRKSDSRRLDSWKAISNYLNRSIRTLRRWEANEGLPIHRHRHQTGDTVFAYCVEIDAWLAARPPRGAAARKPVPAAESAPSHASAVAAGRGGLRAALYAGALLLAGAAAATLVLLSADRIGRAPAADFDVLVSAPVLSDAVAALEPGLADAVQRGIATAVPARSVPPARLRDTLGLMRLAPGTTLSPPVAREVLLRDPDARLLLIPYVTRTADHYVLSLEAVSDGHDTAVDYLSVTVSDVADVLPALNGLARRAVDSYVAVADTRSAEPLPSVTTSSLSAARLYARARDALRRDETGAALRLLELAVEQDPAFASARTLLGWALWRDGARPDAVLPVFEEATKHSDGLIPAERYFVDGSYRHALGDHALAVANYNALFEIDPGHEPAAVAALTLCTANGGDADCLAEHRRVAELRPAHFDSNARAAWALAASGDASGDARKYAKRALALYREQPQGHATETAGRMLLYPVLAAWQDGDMALAMEECRRLRAELPELPADVREFVAERLGGIALAMGRPVEAGEMFDQLTDPQRRHELKARVLFASGEKEAWGQHLSRAARLDDPFTVVLLAMAGRPAEARRAFEGLERDALSPAQLAVLEAALDWQGDRHGAASERLARHVGQLAPADREFFFLGLDMYARLLKDAGELPAAINALEITAVKQQVAAFNDAGLFWIKCQERLAAFYAAAGRSEEAAAVQRELERMLVFAEGRDAA